MTQTVPAEYRAQMRALGSASKLQSIEGMRGLLALLVCGGHLGMNTAAAHFGIKVKFDLAVDIFFILSGFVLSKSYYFGQRSFGRLLKARIARLYPLHALTLIITLAVFFAASKTVDWSVVAQNAALIHNIGLPPNRFDLNFPSWSISVEVALSLLFWFAARKDRDSLYPVLIISGICFAYLAFDGNMKAAENKLSVLNVGLLRGIAGFCFGSAAFMVTERFGQELRACNLLALPLFVAILPFFILKKWTPEVAIVFELLTFLFLIVSVANDQSSFLSLPPFVFLGAISYSVYLLHIPVSFAMELVLPDEFVRGAGKLAQLTVILAAATLSHRAFELPMQRLIMRLPFAPRDRAQPQEAR